MMYTSINNEKIKNIRKLLQKKYRDEEGMFIVEGFHLVEEAFKNNYLLEVYLKEGMEIDVESNVFYVTEEVMKTLSNLQTPPNVIGVCKKIEEKEEYGNKIIFLDTLQDPGNIGTIIRSASAFNIDTIILRNSVDLYNEKVVRATQGLIFKKNIIQTNDTKILDILKENNYKIFGTNVKNGINVKDVYKCEKFVIIFGNEGNGVTNEVEEYVSANVYIKMNEACESLNVGVAASIIMYELDK